MREVRWRMGPLPRPGGRPRPRPPTPGPRPPTPPVPAAARFGRPSCSPTRILDWLRRLHVRKPRPEGRGAHHVLGQSATQPEALDLPRLHPDDAPPVVVQPQAKAVRNPLGRAVSRGLDALQTHALDLGRQVGSGVVDAPLAPAGDPQTRALRWRLDAQHACQSSYRRRRRRGASRPDGQQTTQQQWATKCSAGRRFITGESPFAAGPGGVLRQAVGLDLPPRGLTVLLEEIGSSGEHSREACQPVQTSMAPTTPCNLSLGLVLCCLTDCGASPGCSCQGALLPRVWERERSGASSTCCCWAGKP